MVLILGDTGYIGSHTLQALCAKGLSTIAQDNLSAGQGSLVLDSISFIEGDVANIHLVREAINVVEEINRGSLGATFITREQEDIATLVAESLKIPKTFPWCPKRDSLHEIVRSESACKELQKRSCAA